MKILNFILVIFFLTFFISCSSTQVKTDRIPVEDNSTEHFIDKDVYDPLEGINRRVYYLNSKFDKYLLLPITNIYSTYTPSIFQKGIHNFFSNLTEVPTFINSSLQFKAKKSGTSFARFGINSTVGLFGFFDVASKFHLKKVHEDFGQTLGFYGIPSGPYLVLPILGPSNLRDTTGKIISSYTLTYVDPLKLVDTSQSNIEFTALNGINTRKNTNFKYYHSGSAFEYDYIRFLYLKFRKLEIKK